MESKEGAPINLLERVRDAQTVSKLLHRVDELVRLPGALKVDVLASRRWVAAPVETANHLDKNVWSRLVKHGQGASGGRLFAVETEVGVTERECYSLSLSEEALAPLNWELGLMYCALLPAEAAWLVLCTRDEHFVVAGDREFVEAVLGKEVGQALEEFRTFASDSAWSEAEREFLQRVWERYAAMERGTASGPV